MRCGMYGRLDSPQHRVPIPHPPLPIVDLRQSRIQGPSAGSRRSGHGLGHRTTTPAGGSSVLIARQRLDELGLVPGTLEPSHQVKALNKRTAVDGGGAGHFLVELLGSGIVGGDGDVPIDPGEIDAAQANLLALGRKEARLGIDGDGDAGRMHKYEVRRLG